MIEQLLRIRREYPIKKYQTTKDWSLDYYKVTKNNDPIDKAIIGGFLCQQFSFAFLAGYQAALEQMFPAVAPNQLKALCVSEAKGGHPKSIETSLVDQKITGIKTYITAGTEVEHLLILCKTNEVIKERPVLKIVHVPMDVDGMEVTNFELPFMKDIKHGKAAMNEISIKADQILDGDGYSQYTKPFRTLEDVCVSAAYQAMLLRQAIDHKWEDNLRDQLLLNIYTLKNILTLAPLEAETHLLLSAADHSFQIMLPAINKHIAENTEEHFKMDWEANKKILTLGEKIKAIRISKARNLLFSFPA